MNPGWSPTPGFWEGRRVLVTGHTGFKGAWLCHLLGLMGAEVSGLALPPDPAGGMFDQVGLAGTLASASHFVDIRDGAAVIDVMNRHRPEVVLHLAAQALVRRSFEFPTETFDINVTGTASVLAAAAAVPDVRTVVAVTSDKVYSNDGSGRPFVESDQLGGGDPYSASKAAAELVVASWRHSYRAASPTVVSARAGNVIGGGDHAADRLLPDFFRSLNADEPLVVRYPESVRPWQFVLEPLFGYLTIAEAAFDNPQECPGAVNFGPGADSSWPVAAVVDALIAQAGRGEWRRDGAAPIGPEATLLTLDSSLANDALGWCPVLDLPTALEWTTEWWLAEQSGASLSDLASTQIERYRAMMAA